jgi:hypothetical protein
MLLKYNYSWENTGGARIALAGEDGEVVLVHDVPVADLDLQELRVVLVHLTSSMAAWRETLVAFEAPAARHDQPFDGIRV